MLPAFLPCFRCFYEVTRRLTLPRAQQKPRTPTLRRPGFLVTQSLCDYFFLRRFRRSRRFFEPIFRRLRGLPIGISLR